MGIAPQLSDAELATLAVPQALLGFTSEARRKARRAHTRSLLPYPPQQPGYNKRPRAARGLIRHCTRALAASTSRRTGGVRAVDSTPVECARSRETVKRPALAGRAQYGYRASRSRWFRGLRPHLLRTLHGLPAGLTLPRPARKGEPEPAGRQYLKPLRQVIESVNDTFKGQLDLERHGGRTVDGVTVRVLQRVLALTAAIWHNDATGQPATRSLVAYHH